MTVLHNEWEGPTSGELEGWVGGNCHFSGEFDFGCVSLLK